MALFWDCLIALLAAFGLVCIAWPPILWEKAARRRREKHKRNGEIPMDLNGALEKLDVLEKRGYAYGTGLSALYLDGDTAAPPDTEEGRSLAVSVLAGEWHEKFTAPETGELLEFLTARREELDHVRRRQVEELKRDYDRDRRIPADEYMEFQRLTSEAGAVWKRAKAGNDFGLFLPYLEKIVAFNRKFAGYYDPGLAPYDALLNEFERGTSMAFYDPFFAALRERIVPLLRAVGEREQPDDSFLRRRYPVEAQRKFSGYLMEIMGLDRNHVGIAETEHPFTLSFNNRDARITTHYYEDDVAASMYSVIHEGGHAKYDLGVADDLQYTRLAGGVSMGLHESQSRFYENLIGRSLPFIRAVFPKMKEFFPEQLSDVTPEMFWRAVNRARPSLIRTEADELTYPLHIMVRYEIEKRLIDGSLEARDVPSAWNRLYREYLGVDVPDDTRGCLQDSHWAGGSLGYFPAYALGSAYGAQMLRNMEKEIDVWGPVGRGDLSQVNAWLGEKVHRFGGLLEPAEVVKNACGEFDPDVYADYLTGKYAELYHL